MLIGYACIALGVNEKTTRRLTLKSFTEEKLLDTIECNLIDLQKILEYNNSHGIKLFRISSDIIPLGSHEINNVSWHKYFKPQLSTIGKYIKDNNMRVSMHPGQYTVLNSQSDEVVDKAVKDLEYHTRFLDSLELDTTNKIILHVGGIYGDKEAAVNRFIKNYRKLSQSVKNRLVIENDEKNYSIDDVLDISNEIHVPVIFDNLHNECNTESSLCVEEIMTKVSKTWSKKDGPVKVHYSQQDTEKKMGAHSKTINLKEFLEYYKDVCKFNPDIMIEVKDKNISALKCNYVLEELENKLKKSSIYDEWAKYKYVLMERNYKYYKECSKIVKNNCTIKEFYDYIDQILKIETTYKSFVVAAEHVWGYVKNSASEREKSHFHKMLYNEQNNEKTKNYLKKLCEKYEANYVMASYYFYY